MLPRRSSSRARFRDYLLKRKTDKAWSKTTYDGKPAEKLKRGRSFWNLFREFWILLRGHRPTVFAALLTLSLVTGIGLLIPASTKIAIDYILTDKPGPTGIPDSVLRYLPKSNDGALSRTTLLWDLGGCMAALAFLAVALGTVGRFQMTRLTKRIQIKLRRLAFDHAVRLPLNRIHHYKSGGMASLLRDDASQAGELIFGMIYNPWRAIIQLVGTLVILAVVDWRMLAGAIALLPATWITHKTWISRIRPVYRDIKQVRQGIDAATTEAFGGMRVVRGFNQHRAESWRFGTGQNLMARQELLVWWWSRIIEVAWAVIIPVASAAVLVYGGGQVIKGNLTIGDVMMFSTYLIMLLGPLETLTSTASNIQGSLAGFDRVLDLLKEPAEFYEAMPAAELINVDRVQARGRIEIRGVTFAYPAAAKSSAATGTAPPAAAPSSGVTTNGQVLSKGSAASHGSESRATQATTPGDNPPVLRNINLTVNPGETIALVGPSGSGKTTLCNLVARFYDPTHGTMFFDGIDLKKVDVASYRKLLGIVEQDVFLFDGTIAENIAYSNRHATMAEIEAAARNANAAEFIEAMEKKFDTIIGERGVRLSGGQKQRIAIARALLADPLILILDEATSNLDAESEALIQRSLHELMRGRTCFVIAHRLSTIRNADRIVVMDQGEVREIGTHDELIEKQGRYADLLFTQLDSHQRPRPARPTAEHSTG